MATVALDDLASRLNTIACDEATPPDERIAQLRRVIGQLSSEDPPPDHRALIGQAESYIGSLELQREGAALERHMDRAHTRESADVREVLVRDGIATPAELDAAGWPSHEAIDQAEQDGTLAEGVIGMFKEVLHPRSRTGQFRDKPGGAPKAHGRGGGAITGLAAEKPAEHKPPKAPSSPGTAAAIEHIDSLESVAEQLAEVKKFGLNDWPTKGEVASELLGSAADTQEFHTREVKGSPGSEGGAPKRAYTPQRKVVHDQIVGNFLAVGVGSVLGEDHPLTKRLLSGGTLSEPEKQMVRDAAKKKRGGRKPRVLFMAGGPASGKTSALRQAPDLEPDGAVLINPDEIKDRLPEYRKMIEGGDRFAASGVHEESSDLGKRLQTEAMDLGLNAVVDGTGDSKPGKFVGKMKDMDAAGYEVSALYVSIPTDEAVVRATKRAMKSGRWVPEPEIRSQHKNVSGNFEDVAALPFLTDLKLYDNSGTGDARLTAEASGGKVTIADQAAYDTFIAKRDE